MTINRLWTGGFVPRIRGAQTAKNEQKTFSGNVLTGCSLTGQKNFAWPPRWLKIVRNAIDGNSKLNIPEPPVPVCKCETERGGWIFYVASQNYDGYILSENAFRGKQSRADKWPAGNKNKWAALEVEKTSQRSHIIIIYVT